MNTITKTLAMALVAATTALGFTSEAQAATQTLKVGQTSNLSLVVNGRYVKPTLVSATSKPSGVLSYSVYRSLSSGRYFMKVTGLKAGTATIKVRYGSKYYYYYFTVIKPFVAPVPPTPSCSGSGASYRIYSAKVANAVSYRLRCCIGSSSYARSSVISTSSNPSWTIRNAKRGVYYYYWIDVKGTNGTWYGSTSRWRGVIRR